MRGDVGKVAPAWSKYQRFPRYREIANALNDGPGLRLGSSIPEHIMITRYENLKGREFDALCL